MSKLTEVITEVIHTACQAELVYDEEIQRKALIDIYETIGNVLKLPADASSVWGAPSRPADEETEAGREARPVQGEATVMKHSKERLFKRKHVTSCHGTYVYDRVLINDAHIRATLHPDNGGLEQHATIWIGEGLKCFCYCTFNTCSTAKCDYVVRGMLAGIAKRLVYHHKNHIKRRAKLAAAEKQIEQKKGGEK